MTQMFPEIFLIGRAIFLLFRDAKNRSKQGRRFLRIAAFLRLMDRRNRVCSTSLLRIRMRRRSRWILFLHSEKKRKDIRFAFLVTRRTRAGMFMLRTESLLSIYLRIELQRLCRYVLTRRENQRAVEARLKYLLLGAFRSGLILLGLARLYRRQGTITLWPMVGLFQESELARRGIVFLRAGLFFKAGRRPFHYWVPDVYQGTPTLTRAYFRTVRKRGILRLLLTLPIPARMLWRVRRRSMLIGVLGAIPQTHLKRLFRYSSIAQVGYMCLGLLGGSILGKSRVVRYIIIYMITSLHRFGVFARPSGYTTFSEIEASSFAGLKIQMRRVFFSLAGLPPLLGFRGKARVLQNALEVGERRRVRIALISSVLGVFYSLKIVRKLYRSRLPCVELRRRKEISRTSRTFLCRPVILLATGLFLNLRIRIRKLEVNKRK